jgi:hypothetical protein
MAKLIELSTKLPCRGQVDGPDAYDTPPDGFLKLRGFGCRRGYPFTTDALKAYTSNEIQTSKRIRAMTRWTDPDGTTRNYVVCNGGVWKESATPGTFTLISTVAPGGTASRSGATVTFSSVPNGTLVGVVRVGDYFFYDADGNALGGLVSAVAASSLTLTTYVGSGTSGAFTIWRKLTDQDSYFAAAGGRLFVSDGSGPLHEYGEDAAGSSTYIFRQVGIPDPPDGSAPTLAAGSGGALGAGDYSYYICFEDKRGRIGNGIKTRTITATANQKVTMTVMPPAPESPRAVKYRIYRTLVGGSAWYHLSSDVYDESSGVAGQRITVTTGGLTAGAHIYRSLKFEATGNEYEITANDATQIDVSGDITGESATDYVSITGGYAIDTIQAASATFIDYSADADLDTDDDVPAGTNKGNDEPPSGLKYLTAFQGGGRLGGVVGGKFYCTGRSPVAPKQGISDGIMNGLGEFAYWLSSDRALILGPEDGESVQGLFVLRTRLYGVKESSLWWLLDDSTDVTDFQWLPRGLDVGCSAPKTIAVKSEAAYWLGTVGEELDVIRFDGQIARGMLRPILRTTFDTIYNFSEATGVAYKGRYYLSYDSDNGGTNDRTLRYDLKTRTVDEQVWGCGVFNIPYMSTVTPTLLCGAPTTAGHIYEVEAAAQNLGSDTTRLLETGDFHFPDSSKEIRPMTVQLEVIVE